MLVSLINVSELFPYDLLFVVQQKFIRVVHVFSEHVRLSTIQQRLRRRRNIWVIKLYWSNIRVCVYLELPEMWLLNPGVHRRRRSILLLNLLVNLPSKCLEVDVVTGLSLPNHGIQFVIYFDFLSMELTLKVT